MGGDLTREGDLPRPRGSSGHTDANVVKCHDFGADSHVISGIQVFLCPASLLPGLVPTEGRGRLQRGSQSRDQGVT